MSDVIDFLEKMGQDPALRYASRAALDSALAQARLSPQVREALASGDQRALESLLGSDNVCCMIYAPLEEQEQPQEPRQTRAA
jgi:hypothetical protein